MCCGVEGVLFVSLSSRSSSSVPFLPFFRCLLFCVFLCVPFFGRSTCDHQVSILTEKILDQSVHLSSSSSSSSSSCIISLPFYFCDSPHFTASVPAFSSSSFSSSSSYSVLWGPKASFFSRRDGSREKILKTTNNIGRKRQEKLSISPSPFSLKRARRDSRDTEYPRFREESKSSTSTSSPSSSPSSTRCLYTGTEDEDEVTTKKRRPIETETREDAARGGEFERENCGERVLKRRRERDDVSTLGRKSAVTLLPLFRRGLLGLRQYTARRRKEEEEVEQESLSHFIDHRRASSSSFSDRKSSARGDFRNGEKSSFSSSLPSIRRIRKKERREKGRATEHEEDGEGVRCIHLKRERRAREREKEEKRREKDKTNDRFRRPLMLRSKKKSLLYDGGEEKEEEDSFVLSSLLGWLARHHTSNFKTSSTSPFALSRSLHMKTLSVEDEERRLRRAKGRTVRIRWRFYRDEALIE